MCVYIYVYIYIYIQSYILFIYTIFIILVCIYICTQFLYTIFTHSSVDRHLSCFHILTTVNSAATNIEMHVFFQISVHVSFGYIPRCGVPGSHRL